MCNKNSATSATFILGILIGAALGVLYAPAKGTVTRRKLKRLANEAYEDPKEFFLENAEEIKDKLKDTAQEVRGKLADSTQEAREKLAEGKDKLVKEFHKRKDDFVAKFKKED